MRVAIKDTNIIIDLIEIDLIEAFFKLDLKVITSDFVNAEIKGEYQRNLLAPYIGNGLDVLITPSEEMATLYSIRLNRPSLSIADCSVLFLAQKYKALIITGDKPLRIEAEANGIEVHGLLWVIDELVTSGFIKPDIAAQKLIQLQVNSSRLPKAEIESRINKWQK